jgi:hypothetical protein
MKSIDVLSLFEKKGQTEAEMETVPDMSTRVGRVQVGVPSRNYGNPLRNSEGPP